MYRLPSTPSLQAIDAAARLGSYSRAALELGVTHGAISHRIREVEERLGAALFERCGNAMEPTPLARQVLPSIRQALELLECVFPNPDRGRQVLRVGVLPSFAAHWLVRRLDKFHSSNPDILIDLEAKVEVSKVGPGQLDAAIRYGTGPWSGLHSRALVSDKLFPACAPEYKQTMALAGPDDFSRCQLLRHKWQRWTPWCQAAGLIPFEPQNSPAFEDAGLMIDAAIAGQGIALVRTVIADDALRQGALVRLSSVECDFPGAYHFVWSPKAPGKQKAINIFGDWIADQLSAEFGQLPSM